MYCPQCSHQIGQADKFCPNCARPTDPTATRPSEIKTGSTLNAGTPTVLLILGVGLLIVVGIVIVLAVEASRRADRERAEADMARNEVELLRRQQQSIPPPPIQQVQPPTPEPTIQTDEPPPPPPKPKRDPRILKVNEEVSGARWLPFSVPKGGATIRGRLEGDGGMRGEFNCYIMTDEQLTDYRNGRSAPTMFTAEDLTVIDIETWLAAGGYYLVLKNPSPWTNRRISGTVSIEK